MPPDPKVQAGAFGVLSTLNAAALGSMGVKIWPKVTNIVGGKAEFDEVRKRNFYEYEGSAKVPGGFRDKNNTWRETISASELIRYHRDGKLRGWAPNHPLYAFMSAAVNRERLLEHLLHGKKHTLELVLPDNLTEMRESAGVAHYQLFETEENPSARAVPMVPVTDFDFAVALLTAGFEHAQGLTQRRRDDGGKLSFRLMFFGDDPDFLGSLRVLSGDQKTPMTPAQQQTRNCHVFLANRKRLLSHVGAKTPQLIFTAPDEFVRNNPAARNRAVQIHEDALDRDEEAAVKFLGRKRKHY